MTNRVLIDGWVAEIEPPDARGVVTDALTLASRNADSVPIMLMRAARLLSGSTYAVILTNGDHRAALSAGHPAYYRDVDGRHYAACLQPDGDNTWQELPANTLLDIDYCGPTWMPLTPTFGKG